jgi:hypothetical protein
MIGGVAEVAQRYMNLPGTRPATCRDYLANSYALAARLNVSLDPNNDPSADRARAPLLHWKAWRLRPSNVGYLWDAAKFALRSMLKNCAGLMPAKHKQAASQSPKSTLPGQAA